MGCFRGEERRGDTGADEGSHRAIQAGNAVTTRLRNRLYPSGATVLLRAERMDSGSRLAVQHSAGKALRPDDGAGSYTLGGGSPAAPGRTLPGEAAGGGG